MVSSLSLALVSALAAFVPAAVAVPYYNSAIVPRNASGSACNNSPSLCGKNYNAITYLGAHDSAFLRDASTGNSIAGNQFKNATVALDAGIRLLQAQVHDSNNTLELCHTSCGILDGGSLADWLVAVDYWMGKNPNEVVTLLLVNSDEKPVADFGLAFEKSGISKYGFQQTSTTATGNWPTLQSMINNGKRLVTFVTNIDGQDASQYPYLLDEFSYVFETAFEVTDLTGFNCTLDRPSTEDSASAALASNFLGLINHFKYQTIANDIFIPDADAIKTVNSPDTATTGSLGRHLDQCTTEWGTKPNFILVDFWNEADPIEAADAANGLSDVTGRSGGGDDSDDDSMAAVNARNLGHCALVAAFAGAALLF